LALAATVDDPIESRRVAATSADIFRRGELLSDTYEICKVLGAGGMGQVFEAYDRALGRRVAIKAAWPHVDPLTVRREAQALAQLRHPGLVSAYACARHHETDFVVMELVHGTRLDTYLAEVGPPPVQEAVSILRAIAETLSVVHGAGLAHRDVKPANVMLATAGRIVLMDFGIHVPEYDRRGEIMGSPHYMAPETISHHTTPGGAFLVDLYAFGILAHELLTGSCPYDDPAVPRLLRKHLCDPIPDVREKRPDVPSWLATLVSELMAKDPADRPARTELVVWELARSRRAPSAPSIYPVREAVTEIRRRQGP